jgi:AraC-like DNA-binding protein
MNKGDPIFFSAQVSSARRFYLDLKPSPKSQLSVVCGGVEHCTPAFRINRSTFPYHSLEFISGGKGSLTLNTSRHDLHPGMIFTYGPGIRHQIVTDAKRPLIKYFVDFSGLSAARLLKNAGLAPGTMITTSAAKDVMVLFDDLIDTAQQHTRFHRPACKAILEHLLFKIAQTADPLADSPHSFAFGSYQRCRQYIAEHFLELSTLNQIAGECHLDVAYLCRLFSRYDTLTPYQFLLRLKMDEAIRRLHREGVLIKQVAQELDFNDPFHFSRLFRKMYGVSPREFMAFRAGN